MNREVLSSDSTFTLRRDHLILTLSASDVRLICVRVIFSLPLREHYLTPAHPSPTAYYAYKRSSFYLATSCMQRPIVGLIEPSNGLSRICPRDVVFSIYSAPEATAFWCRSLYFLRTNSYYAQKVS